MHPMFEKTRVAVLPLVIVDDGGEGGRGEIAVGEDHRMRRLVTIHEVDEALQRLDMRGAGAALRVDAVSFEIHGKINRPVLAGPSMVKTDLHIRRQAGRSFRSFDGEQREAASRRRKIGNSLRAVVFHGRDATAAVVENHEKNLSALSEGERDQPAAVTFAGGVLMLATFSALSLNIENWLGCCVESWPSKSHSTSGTNASPSGSFTLSFGVI